MAKTTKKTKEAPKRAPKAEGKYTLEVSVNDSIYKGSAPTLVEAVQGFVDSSDFPLAVKTIAVFRYGHGKSKGQRNLFGNEAKKTFRLLKIDPLAVELLAKKMLLDLEK